MKGNLKTILLAGTLAAGVLASTLAAQAVTVGDTLVWLAQNGYTVVEVELSNDGKVIEVKAFQNGARFELHIDVATGVVTIEADGDAPGTPPAFGTPPASDDKSDDHDGSAGTPSASPSDDPSDSASDDPSDSDLSDSEDSPSVSSSSDSPSSP